MLPYQCYYGKRKEKSTRKEWTKVTIMETPLHIDIWQRKEKHTTCTQSPNTSASKVWAKIFHCSIFLLWEYPYISYFQEFSLFLIRVYWSHKYTLRQLFVNTLTLFKIPCLIWLYPLLTTLSLNPSFSDIAMLYSQLTWNIKYFHPI